MHLFDRPWRWALAGLLATGLVGSIAPARADDPPPKAPEKPADPPKEGDKPAVPPKEGEKPPEKPADKPAPKPISDPILAPDPAKDFKLKDLDGKERTLTEFKGKWVVLEWTNYECPFVKKHYKVTPAEGDKPAVPGNMAVLQKTYTGKGVVWLSICSSAPGLEGNRKGPDVEGVKTIEQWKKEMADRQAVPTALLRDEDGTVGRLYGAKNTPTIWIVDPKGNVGYHGAVDDTMSPAADPTKAKNYVAEFLDAVLAGKEPPTRETKPYG